MPAFRSQRRAASKTAALQRSDGASSSVSGGVALVPVGRRSTDTPQIPLYGDSLFLPRSFRDWHRRDLTTLATWPAHQVLDLLSEFDPDVSSAIWSFLRLANTGFNVSVTHLNGKDHTEGTMALRRLIDRLESASDRTGFDEDRSLSTVVNQSLLSAVTRGAMAVEVVLDANREVDRLVAVDPASIFFTRKREELLPTQWAQAGRSIDLDIPTFFYHPIDPRLGDPYGRNPLLSILQIVFFRMVLMRDLQRTYRRIGNPRLYAKVVQKALMDAAPSGIRNDPKKLKDFVTGELDTINQYLLKLNPEDSVTVLDAVDLKVLEPAHTSSFDVRPLLEALNSLITSALKTLQTILGKTIGGRTEALSGSEIVVYSKTLEGLQSYVARMLSKPLTLALNLLGMQGVVKVNFNGIEWRSPLEQEQWRAIRLSNMTRMRDEGWVSEDEASISMVGHPPMGERRIGYGISHTTPQVDRPGPGEPNREQQRQESSEQRKATGTDRNPNP